MTRFTLGEGGQGTTFGSAPDLCRVDAAVWCRSAGAIIESVRDFGELGLVQKTEVDARVIPPPMMFKMYLLNEDQVVFGFYPVVEHEVRIGGKNVAIFDTVERP